MSFNNPVGNSAAALTYFFNDANDSFGINRNADLYANNVTPVNLQEYDYVITLQGALDSLFSTKTYQQSADNINNNDMNNVDVTLTLNNTAFDDMFYNTAMSNAAASITSGVLGSGACDFNTRVLEILAIKIFSHGRARAAIANDSEIIAGIRNDLYNHVNNVVQAHKHDIFNQYVQQDLPQLNADDINSPVPFNFSNDTLAFPGYINGSLVDLANLSDDLKNGPVDGHALVNGLYNVPILIKLGA